MFTTHSVSRFSRGINNHNLFSVKFAPKNFALKQSTLQSTSFNQVASKAKDASQIVSPSLFNSKLNVLPSSVQTIQVMTQIRGFSKTKISFNQRFMYKPRVGEKSPIQLDSQSELATLTPSVAGHLRKVYATLASTSLIAGASCTLGIYGGMSIGMVPSLLGSLGLILGIGFTPREYTTARLGMLYGFAVLQGLSLTPFLAHTAAMYPSVIPAALLATGGVFTGFTALSLVSRSRSMLSLGGPLFGCLLGMIGLNIASFFVPALSGMAHSISLYGGLALFSAYVSYDTQLMIERARLGETDYVSDSLSLFLDLVNIFVRFVSIFRRDE